MRSKKEEPSRAFSIQSSSGIVEELIELITSVNRKIEEHNALVEHFKTQKESLIDEVWGLIILENQNFIHSYEARFVGLNKAIESISKSIKTAKKHIE